MALVYSSEVSVDNIIATPAPDPTITWPPPFATETAFWTAAGLMVGDHMGNRWLGIFGVLPTDSSMGPVTFRSVMQLNAKGTAIGDGLDPWTWAAEEAFADTPGSGTYTAGGTITIAKDVLAGTISMTTPVGTISQTLTFNDGVRVNSANNPTPLFPFGIALTFTVPQDGGAHNPENTDSRAEFFNLEARKNSLITLLIPLSAADPGTFFATAGESFNADGTGGSDPFVNFTESQLLTRYLMETQTTVAFYPSFARGNFWRTIATVPPISNDTDMETAVEHGVIWRGGPDVRDGTVMLVQRSFDNAGTWETWTAFSDPSTSNSSPTVAWYNHRLGLTWHDGTDIQEAHSVNGGRNWAMPTVIPFTGTNPRRVVDRTGGGSFYFYFDGDDLKVVVSYDSGGSYQGPYLVASTVGAQQIDAEFVPDGSLVASYFLAGVWTQKRSRDLGLTWT